MSINLKALTQGRTDHCVTYLPSEIQVCFSGTLPELVFPTSLSLSAEKGTLSSCHLELCPMTLTYENGLDTVAVKHHAKYLGQS